MVDGANLASYSSECFCFCFCVNGRSSTFYIHILRIESSFRSHLEAWDRVYENFEFSSALARRWSFAGVPSICCFFVSKFLPSRVKVVRSAKGWLRDSISRPPRLFAELTNNHTKPPWLGHKIQFFLILDWHWRHRNKKIRQFGDQNLLDNKMERHRSLGGAVGTRGLCTSIFCKYGYFRNA